MTIIQNTIEAYVLRVFKDREEFQPIIAWHMDPYSPIPILLGNIPPNCIDLVVYARGRAFDYKRREVFATTEEAIASCRGRLA